MAIRTKQALPGSQLSTDSLLQTLHTAIAGNFTRQRILVLIPDHTRTLPLPMLFQALVEMLGDTRQLDFMVALGTQPSLDETSLNKLVGIDAEERSSRYARIGLFNHAWDNLEALETIGMRFDIQYLTHYYVLPVPTNDIDTLNLRPRHS